jgi:outer membrane protein assembly factor BamB
VVLAPDDFRPLLAATLAALVVLGGQVFAVGSAFGGSLGGVVFWVVAAALGALVVVARTSAAAGAWRRVLESSVAAFLTWLVLDHGFAERLDGFGLDHAAGLGVGAAVALAGRTPSAVVIRLATLVTVLAAGVVLDDRGTVADVGLLLPVAVVPGVILADGAFGLAARRRLLPAAVLVVLPVAAVAAAVAIENLQRDRAQREAVEAARPPAAKVGRERIAWAFTAPTFNAGPLVAGDVIVADAADGVHGIDAETGAERWLARVPGRDGIPKPVVDGDLLLYPANLAGLYALEVQTGRQRWRFRPEGHQFWGAAPAGDVVVAGAWADRGPRLLGIRRRDGRQLWTKDFASDRFELAAGPDGVRLNMGAGSWRVDPRDGGLTPRQETEADYTYGDFSALRSTKRGWKYRAGWEASTSEPVEVDGVVYVNIRLDPAKVNGGLYALDAATGRLLWRVEITGDPAHRPAVRGPFVYVTSSGTCDGVGACRSNLYAIRRSRR